MVSYQKTPQTKWFRANKYKPPGILLPEGSTGGKNYFLMILNAALPILRMYIPEDIVLKFALFFPMVIFMVFY